MMGKTQRFKGLQGRMILLLIFGMFHFLMVNDGLASSDSNMDEVTETIGHFETIRGAMHLFWRDHGVLPASGEALTDYMHWPPTASWNAGSGVFLIQSWPNYRILIYFGWAFFNTHPDFAAAVDQGLDDGNTSVGALRREGHYLVLDVGPPEDTLSPEAMETVGYFEQIRTAMHAFYQDRGVLPGSGEQLTPYMEWPPRASWNSSPTVFMIQTWPSHRILIYFGWGFFNDHGGFETEVDEAMDDGDPRQGDLRREGHYLVLDVFPPNLDPGTQDLEIVAGPSIISVSARSALIEWTTNLEADASLAFGLREDALDQTVTDPAAATVHQLTAGSLTPDTIYYFRATSMHNNRFATSTVGSFTTTPDLTPQSIGHPRLFLDDTKLAFIREKASQGDPDFQELVAYSHGKMHESQLPDPWNFGSAFTGSKDGYRGSGYLDRIQSFALLYQAYRDSDLLLAREYASWGIRVMDEIISDFTVTVPGIQVSHNAGLEAVREFATINNDEFEFLRPFYEAHFDFQVVQPPHYKGGYAARNFGMAMALGYDWLFEEIPEGKRALYREVMYRWVDWYEGRRSRFNTGAKYNGVFFHEDRERVDGPQDNSNIDGPWGERPWHGYGYDTESGNFFGGYFLMHALCALATFGDDAYSQDCLDAFLMTWERLRARLGDAHDMAGGDHPEGWQYGTAYQSYITTALLGAYPSMPQILHALAWPEQTARAYLYATKPSMDKVHVHGEWTGSYIGLYDKGVLPLADLLRKQQNPCAPMVQYHLNHADFVPQTRAHPWHRVMFYDPQGEACPFGDLPLVYNASGTGLVQGRNSWNYPDKTIWWAFQAGTNYYGDHEAYDAGHFSLSRGGDDLLLRSGSRYVEDQNTVSFSKPGQTCLTQVPGVKETTGERRIREEVSLIHVYADLTEAHGQTRQHVRQLVHFFPGVVILFDRMTSQDGQDVSKRWHFNTPAETQLDHDRGVITAYAGDSKALIHILYPESFNLETTPLDETFCGAVSSGHPFQRDYFLHLVLALDRDETPTVATESIQTGECLGAVVLVEDQGYGVVFSKGEGLRDDAHFSMGLGGGKRIFVGDLAEGMFNVFKDGQLIAEAVATRDNSLIFEDTGPGGDYVIQKKDAPLPPSPGPVFTFEERMGHGLAKPGHWGFDVAAGDLDGDGLEDLIFLSHEPLAEGSTWVYRNGGDFTFSLMDIIPTDEGNHLHLVDINQNGALDLVVTHDWKPLDFCINDGQGGFQVSGQSLFGEVPEIAFDDLDGDRDLDLLGGTTKRNGSSGVWLNQGAFEFLEECGASLGLKDVGPATNIFAADFNGDGLNDIFQGVWSYDLGAGFSVLHMRRPDGNFIRKDLDVRSFNGIPGDFDLDGDMDLLFLYSLPTDGESHPTLCLNDGSANFTQRTHSQMGLPGAIPATGQAIDLDHDGDLDLVTSGYGKPNLIFENLGGMRFRDATDLSQFIVGDNTGYVVRGADLDHDGDMDLIAMSAHNHGDEAIHVFENKGSEHHWVVLRLRCAPPNTHGIGAKGYLYKAGHLNDSSRLLGYDQIRSAFHSPMIMHFGVGQERAVDIKVVLPNGAVQTMVNLPVDQVIDIRE